MDRRTKIMEGKLKGCGRMWRSKDNVADVEGKNAIQTAWRNGR